MRAFKLLLAKLLVWAVAPLFLVLAVYGAVQQFTGVPRWDSWASYVAFYFKVLDGHWGAWWEPHNEHRIVLSRLLFWADMAWLRGSMWMLVAANYLLLFGAFLTWRAIVRERAAAAGAPPFHTRVLLAFIFVCLFSWMQRENLYWEFQSQFILAQWLPLLALYSLYQSLKSGGHGERWFVVACLMGVLSVGSMANGVLALPLMAVYAIWLRMGWRRVTVLAALGAVCAVAYWSGTPGADGQGHVVRARGDWVLIAQYVLLYLGSPFNHLFSMRTGQVFGALLILLATGTALTRVRKPRDHAIEWCMLFYLAYIGGTALGTALGRAQLGLDQAASSRYATPALMAWIAMIVIYQPFLLRQLAAWRGRVFWPMVVLVIALTGAQWKAREADYDQVLEHRAGALAMAMGIQDEQQIRHVFYAIKLGFMIAERSVAAHRSVYATPAFATLDTLDHLARPLPSKTCRASLLARSVLADDPRYLRVEGWMDLPDQAGEPTAVRFVSPTGVVMGYAVAGRRNGSARSAVGLGGSARFFRGYVEARAMSPDVTLDIRGTGCVAKPRSMGILVDAVPHLDADGTSVSVSSVQAEHGWEGADFDRSKLPGLQIRGTFVHGDVDTGAIRLVLHRGDRLLYRTGPSTSRQTYRIGDGRLGKGYLPQAQTWSALVFDDPALPDQFELTLSDEGGSWGEWMAIALKSQPGGVSQ